MAKARKPGIKDLTIDEVCKMLYEGKTYRAIADHYGVHVSTVGDFIAKPEHSARAHEALIASADMYAEMAEQVLKEATWKAKGQDFDLKKARELAQHYRWMAAKRNPKKYGDKVDVTSGGDKVQGQVIVWGGNEIKV